MSLPPTAPAFDPGTLRALNGLDFRARYLVEGYLSGLHRSPFHGSSVEFSEYRDYQPGDDLRQLDWRLYARSDRLHIKRFEQETEARVYLLMDRSASMDYEGTRAWGSKAACATTLAAAMAWMLLKQKDPVGLLGFRLEKDGQKAFQYQAPSCRRGRLSELLGELGRLPVGGDSQLPELLAHALRLIRRRSVLLIFSDLLEPVESIETALKHLRFLGHEVLVFQTLDPDEIDFPFQDAGIFMDPETGDRRQVDPDKSRRDYLERFEAFMGAHRDLFARIRVAHRVFRGDENPGPALASFLHLRS